MKIGRDSTEGEIVTVIVVGDARVVFADCRDVLKTLADCSVDSVVTDPPYELGFMGKKWDSSGIAYDVSVWEECLRVLKPGGHVLAFGGSRTFHRMAVAIEDAGFEIRDSIAWMYGSGFPKSLDVSKAIDKKLGAEREVVGYYTVGGNALTPLKEKGGTFGVGVASSPSGQLPITSAGSDEGKQWEGWGTALKPAFEPIVVGRKPFAKGSTVAANVLEHGVGGLNIDASRVESAEDTSRKPSLVRDTPAGFGKGTSLGGNGSALGRWPANVILDEYSAGLLDEQSGHLHGSGNKSDTGKGADKGYDSSSYEMSYQGRAGRDFGKDGGGASRFFYCAKASKRDRNEGLDGLEAVAPAFGGDKGDGLGRGISNTRQDMPKANFHPTVKPTTLMRYLIKLVTPAGGTVLDPFTGSGSTGKAALLDGYKFVGAELTEEYLPIIEGRLRWAYEQEGDEETLF